MMLEALRKSVEDAQPPGSEVWRATNWAALATSIDAVLELFDSPLHSNSPNEELDGEMLGQLQELYDFKW